LTFFGSLEGEIVTINNLRNIDNKEVVWEGYVCFSLFSFSFFFLFFFVFLLFSDNFFFFLKVRNKHRTNKEDLYHSRWGWTGRATREMRMHPMLGEILLSVVRFDWSRTKITTRESPSKTKDYECTCRTVICPKHHKYKL
jgi:hypothetical protein